MKEALIKPTFTIKNLFLLFALILPIVGLCWGVRGISQTTNNVDLIKRGTNAVSNTQKNFRGDLWTILCENGNRLGCSFTLECQGDLHTQPYSRIMRSVTVNLDADSIPSFISNLRDYLDGLTVMQDSKNSNVVHIIDNVLVGDANYVLNKKISLNYSGSLPPTRIPGGPAATTGGLLAAVADKAPDIRFGGAGVAFIDSIVDQLWDGDTQVDIHATNETVRSILTDCLPTTNYSPVMWRSENIMRYGTNANRCVFVQFFGPNPRLKKSTGE